MTVPAVPSSGASTAAPGRGGSTPAGTASAAFDRNQLGVVDLDLRLAPIQPDLAGRADLRPLEIRVAVLERQALELFRHTVRDHDRENVVVVCVLRVMQGVSTVVLTSCDHAERLHLHLDRNALADELGGLGRR